MKGWQGVSLGLLALAVGVVATYALVSIFLLSPPPREIQASQLPAETPIVVRTTKTVTSQPYAVPAPSSFPVALPATSTTHAVPPVPHSLPGRLATERVPSISAPAVPAPATQEIMNTPGVSPQPTRIAPGGAVQAKFVLMREFRGIGEIVKGDPTSLTSTQAQAILAIMTPLQTQPTLSAAQAGDVLHQLQALLTPAQQTVIAQSLPRHATWRDGRLSGHESETGEPETRHTADGARPTFGARETFNPFYTATDQQTTTRATRRWQAIFSALDAKAKQ